MRLLRAKIIHTLHNAINDLSLSGRLLFWTLVVIFVGATLWMLADVSASFLVTVPERGGTFTVGIVGKPQFINPVLASDIADKDMATLVYSGLTRWDTRQQKLVPDAAKSWSVSPDGTIYTFVLKKGLMFQDGTPLSADDVVFTIHAIQDPHIHSPLAATWVGIKVNKIDNRTIQFILPTPYAPFLDNTTVGILPAHLWQNIPATQFASAALNSDPVGSGPYTVSAVQKDASGAPLSYTLTPFSNFALGKPYIGQFIVQFYENEEAAFSAAQNYQIDELSGISTEETAALKHSGFQISRFPLPRVFGVFFNQTQNIALADPVVRQALALATDRNAIVKAVFGNNANPLTGPVPPAFLPGSTTPLVTQTGDTASTTLAAALLDKDGWFVNNNGIREKKRITGTTTLSIALSTADVPELVSVANLLVRQWRAIGVDASVKVFSSGFEDQVIQPRNYDALLFGQDVGRSFDLYPFWASSEIADPGLNIALYENPTADVLLDDLRATTSPSVVQYDYTAFAAKLAQDIPAIFIYEPDLIDANRTLAGAAEGPITAENERFNDVYHWYTKTQEVWKIFAATTTQSS